MLWKEGRGNYFELPHCYYPPSFTGQYYNRLLKTIKCMLLNAGVSYCVSWAREGGVSLLLRTLCFRSAEQLLEIICCFSVNKAINAMHVSPGKWKAIQVLVLFITSFKVVQESEWLGTTVVGFSFQILWQCVGLTSTVVISPKKTSSPIQTHSTVGWYTKLGKVPTVQKGVWPRG